MSTALQGRMAIRARQIKPGEAYAVEVKAGQYIQITDVAGKQVADFVAFNAANRSEHLSVAATRTVASTIMLQQGMQLVSNRRTPMFELVEDTVGRHDILLALCDPVVETAPPDPPAEAATDSAAPPLAADPAPDPDPDPDSNPTPTPITETGDAGTPDAPVDSATPSADAEGTPDPDVAPVPAPSLEPAANPGCLTALSRALDPFGIAADQVPDPINWFMNVGIKGRGEIEVREPLSERNDFVVLSALMDSIVAITACSRADDDTNGAKPTDVLVRVYR